MEEITDDSKRNINKEEEDVVLNFVTKQEENFNCRYLSEDDAKYFDYLYDKMQNLIINGKREFDSRIVFKLSDPHKKVSEIIGEEWKSWNYNNPIYIFTPTGSGKNTFIKNNLVSSSTKILLISNRIALNIQMKKELINSVMDNETLTKQVIDWGKQEFSKLYNEQPYSKVEELWLKETKKFENLHICNYQGLLSFIKDYNENIDILYDYIVCDEAHFFCSDAEFNVDTGNILKAIHERFPRSKRIYMTATPDRVFEHIFEKNNPHKQIVYGSKADYSYVLPNIIDDIQKLCELIINDKSNEKWLIFVNSKKTGEELVKIINAAMANNNLDKDKKKEDLNEELEKAAEGDYNEKELKLLMKKIGAFVNKKDKNVCATFIYAGKENIGTDKESLDEYMHKLVNRQGFEEKVLITTPVLDNGFSFSDELIKNIVIMNLDKVAFLQMLGRRRVKADEKINLFLVKPSENHVSGVITRLEEKIAAINLMKYNNYEKIEENYYNGTVNDFAKIVGLIKIRQGKYVYNELAEEQISEKLDFYEKILANKDDPYWANKEQLKWLGKYQDGDSVEQYRFGAPQEELIKFLDSHIDEEILANETTADKKMDDLKARINNGEILSKYIQFLYEFRTKYDVAYRSDSKSKILYSMGQINKCFQKQKNDLPYIIFREDKKDGKYITLKRLIIEEETDIEENE